MPLLEPRWLSARDTADYICVRVGDLSCLVKQGRIPAPAYLLGPRQPRWDRLALDVCFEGRSGSNDMEAAAQAIAQRILSEPTRRRRRTNPKKGEDG